MCFFIGVFLINKEKKKGSTDTHYSRSVLLRLDLDRVFGENIF